MSVVLVADDEEALLEIFATVIKDMGHQVIEATNGKDALQLARTHKPALIISDFMMPGCNGLELLHAVRAEGDLANIPFVLVSAALPQGREEADYFLGKPVPVEKLERIVRDILRAKAPESAPEGINLTVNQRANGPVMPDMFGWLAHELKVPLSAAKMTIESLRMEADPANLEVRERRYRRMTQLLEEMEATITTALDAAQLTQQKLAVSKQKHDFVAIVAEMLDYWREARPEFEFVLMSPDDSITLEIDAIRVRQIVNNLLANAVKYSLSAKRIDVAIRTTAATVELDVVDSGIGIASEELPRIFNRFHRAHTAAATGHGLGLFIASALTLLHGGSLNVKSEPGKGSTFTLALPRKTR